MKTDRKCRHTIHAVFMGKCSGVVRVSIVPYSSGSEYFQNNMRLMSLSRIEKQSEHFHRPGIIFEISFHILGRHIYKMCAKPMKCLTKYLSKQTNKPHASRLFSASAKSSNTKTISSNAHTQAHLSNNKA